MAVIEEQDSSDEAESPVLSDTPLHNVKPALRGPSRPAVLDKTDLQRLISQRKQKLDSTTLQPYLGPADIATTLADVLDGVAVILDAAESAEELDVALLDRLVAALAIIEKQADPVALKDAFSPTAAEIVTRSISRACHLLRIPSIFWTADEAATAQESQIRSFWLAGSTSVVLLIRELLGLHEATAIFLADQAALGDLVISLSKLLPHNAVVSNTHMNEVEEAEQAVTLDAWTTQVSAQTSTAILEDLLATGSNADNGSSSRQAIVQHVLLTYIKPLFSSNPHPMLNPETGRKLERRRGGDLFGDSYSDPPWKGNSLAAEDLGAIGCWKVYIYLIKILKPQDFEHIWPFLVPPMMSLLDDHETFFKRQGIVAVSTFLSRVPSQLVRRTGLHELLHRSFRTTYSCTSMSENAPMIRDAVLTDIQLINLLYPRITSDGTDVMSAPSFKFTSKQSEPPALTRFNLLSSIFKDCIMNIFTFAASNIHFMSLAFSLIPVLIRQLGKGSIRYLGDIMPILWTSLGGSPATKALVGISSKEVIRMHVRAAQAIEAYVTICSDIGRIHRWRGMIISACATMWCNLQENSQGQTAVEQGELRAALQSVLKALRSACGNEVQTDLERIKKLDETIFARLLDT